MALRVALRSIALRLFSPTWKQIRHMARICAKDNTPPCSPEKDAKADCDRERLKKLLKSYNFKEECCGNPCLMDFPRFDDIYYKPSDKAKRIYTRTWNECPRDRIVPKKVCLKEKLIPPTFVKRVITKKTRKQLCKLTEDAKRLMPYPAAIKRVCPRLENKCQTAACPQGRNPPKCLVVKRPKDCKKICTPYPSFSECIRDDPKPRAPSECRCKTFRPLCAARAQQMKKPSK